MADYTYFNNEKAFRQYCNEIGRYKLLTAEEEQELAWAIRNGENAEEARERLINSNLRLVVSIAKKFYSEGMTIEDIVQEGNIGLMKAVSRFDVTKGCRFSTYATWWIRESIIRAIQKQGHIIRVPIGESVPYEVVSLDKPIGEEGDTCLSDYIADENSTAFEEEIFQSELAQMEQEILNELPDKEAEVLKYRLGFHGRIYSLQELGDTYGLSRERIRQIEEHALKTIRRNEKKTEQLKDYRELA